MEITLVNNTITIVDPTDLQNSYVHTVQKVTTIETTLYDYSIVDTSSSFVLGVDGYYIISSMKILSSETPGSYYTVNDIIYDPNGEVITAEELLEVDTTGTNIIREDDNIILYYFLETYYIDLIKNKFSKDICGCDCDKQTNQIIDTLTMGIEVIKYLTTYNQFYEAQRIIEQLSVCTGVVNQNCNCNA